MGNSTKKLDDDTIAQGVAILAKSGGHAFNSDVSCGDDGFDIVPDNDVDLPAIVRQIYVGGAGDVRVITKAGTTMNFKGLPAGGYISGLRIARVLVTGTTATLLNGVI